MSEEDIYKYKSLQKNHVCTNEICVSFHLNVCKAIRPHGEETEKAHSKVVFKFIPVFMYSEQQKGLKT